MSELSESAAGCADSLSFRLRDRDLSVVLYSHYALCH